MKNMKRIVSLLLVGVLALSVLTGCNSAVRSEFGELLLDEVMKTVSEDFLDGAECKNDPTLKKELNAMLNKLEPVNGMVSMSDAKKINYSPSKENCEKVQYCGLIGSNDGQNYKVLDCAEDEWDGTEAALWVLSNHIEGKCEYYMSAYELDKLTNFAMSYKVVKDSQGKEHLYIAYAFTVEKA